MPRWGLHQIAGLLGGMGLTCRIPPTVSPTPPAPQSSPFSPLRLYMSTTRCAGACARGRVTYHRHLLLVRQLSCGWAAACLAAPPIYSALQGIPQPIAFPLFSAPPPPRQFGGTKTNSEAFNTAGRSVKSGLTACDIVSKWTWAVSFLFHVSRGLGKA